MMWEELYKNFQVLWMADDFEENLMLKIIGSAESSVFSLQAQCSYPVIVLSSLMWCGDTFEMCYW